MFLQEHFKTAASLFGSINRAQISQKIIKISLSTKPKTTLLFNG